MSSQTLLRINNPHVVSETMDGESVLINLKTGYYYSLNGIGSDIWQALERQVPTSKLIESFLKHFSDQKKEVREGLDELFENLLKEELVISGREESQNDHSGSTDSDITASFSNSSFSKPVLQKFGDMKDMLLLDPIHEVDEEGWPNTKQKVSP